MDKAYFLASPDTLVQLEVDSWLFLAFDAEDLLISVTVDLLVRRVVYDRHRPWCFVLLPRELLDELLL